MSECAPENSSTPVATTRPRWLDEVDAIDYQILSAKMRRNTLVPVASLPPEILGDVFEYLAHDLFSWTYHSHRSLSSHKPVAWPAIMLVCKNWRDTAVKHHALWTYLTQDNLELWPLFIERSHSNLLDIRLYSESEEIYGPLSAALLQLRRLRSIHLQLQETMMERILPLLNIPAPNLQDLHLQMAYGVVDHYGTITPTRTTRWSSALRGDFVSELTPNLRRVYLSGVCFPWGTSAENILDLTMDSGIPLWGPAMSPSTVTLSVSDICRGLSHLRLQHLGIHDLRIHDLSMTSNASAEIRGQPSFALTDLRVLRLSDVPAALALPIWYSTANNGTSPTIVSINVNSLPDTFSRDQLLVIARHAASHMSRHSSDIERLIIRFSPSLKLNVKSNVLDFVMPAPAFDFDRSALIFEMLQEIPLMHLTALELGNHVDFSQETFLYLLTRLPLLVDLKLSARAETVGRLCYLLMLYRVESGERDRNPDSDLAKFYRSPALPRLRTLNLSHVDFTLELGGRKIESFLKGMLYTRTKSDPPVGPTGVDIRECDVTQEMVSSWTVGGTVDVMWDRRMGKCASENEEWWEAEYPLDT